MRSSLWMSMLAVGAVVCAVPASVALAQGAAAKPAAPGPCSDGTCKITIQLPPEIAPDLNTAQINYKAYKGCPRDLGYNKDATDIRAATPIVESHNPTLSLPAFDGKVATVVFFMGPLADQVAVADFSKSKTIMMPAPYMQKSDAGQAAKKDDGKQFKGAAGDNAKKAAGKTSSAFDDDDVLDNKNASAITKCKA